MKPNFTKLWDIGFLIIAVGIFYAHKKYMSTVLRTAKKLSKNLVSWCHHFDKGDLECGQCIHIHNYGEFYDDNFLQYWAMNFCFENTSGYMDNKLSKIGLTRWKLCGHHKHIIYKTPYILADVMKPFGSLN